MTNDNTAEKLRACREAFETWWFDYVSIPSKHPVPTWIDTSGGYYAEDDLDTDLAFDAYRQAWSNCADSGEAVAWRLIVDGCDPQFVTDIQFFKSLDIAGIAYTKEPLFTHPSSAAVDVRDAERYRWLRQKGALSRAAHIAVLTHNGGYAAEEDAADRAIDDALSKRMEKGNDKYSD